jgi:hypothetical protein
MTHLLPAYFTTSSTRKRKPKPQTKAAADHAAWLLKMGVSPKKPARKVVDKSWQKEYAATLSVERGKYESSGLNIDQESLAKRDIMSRLNREPEHVQRAILEKASRVMPLFNKGGLQYASPETDMTTVGSKSRRG